MCVSNEPCQTKEEKRAVLAQSSFRRLRLIGRMPDSEWKPKAFTHMHGEKVSERSGKKELCWHKALLDDFGG